MQEIPLYGLGSQEKLSKHYSVGYVSNGICLLKMLALISSPALITVRGVSYPYAFLYLF